MRRLTERNTKTINGKYVLRDSVWTADAIQRLGEYEDTGLFPNDITNIVKFDCKWFSPLDVLPAPGTTVLVYISNSYSNMKVAEYTINCRWQGVRPAEILRWAYLPEIPKE